MTQSGNGGLLAPPGTALIVPSAEASAGGGTATSERAAIPPTPGARLRQLSEIFLRRGPLMLFMLAALNGLTLFGMSRLTARYTAEALLIIGPRQAQVVDVKAVIAGLTNDSDVIESEMQILRSRRIAEEVVTKLGLDRDPDFQPPDPGPSLHRRLITWFNARLHGVAAVTPAALQPLVRPTPIPPLPQAEPRTPVQRATDTFLRHLWVSQKGHSRVISVSFDSADPVLAAAAANGVAEAYIQDQLGSKLEATAHARRWLDERVRELREQVINADQAVEEYRQKIGLLQGRNANLLSEQMSEVSDQIMRANGERARAEARLRAVELALTSARSIEGLPEIQSSVVVQNLRKQQSALLQSAAELSRSFGEGYPKLTAVRSEIADVQARLRLEIEQIVAGLRENFRIAQAQQAYLEDKLGELRSDVATGHQGEIELHALQHEADADRVLYDRLLARAKETSVESGLQQPDAQMISRAEQPEAPSFPNPVLILPLFFVASCIIVVLLVFALESLDRGFSSLEQIDDTLGVSGLAVMPRLRRSARMPLPERYVLERPASHYGEALRCLYTSLLLSDVARPPKVVLIASAVPGEGKTTLGLSLARLMARAGKRVVIVDCDVRRPALHSAFGVPRTPGLTDYLTGSAELDAVLSKDSSSSAHLMAAGSPSQTAPDLFAGDAMRRLIRTLSKCFDLVLLDSAPVLMVSDTRNLCRLSDATAFVVRWQDTRRQAVQTALRQIMEAGGKVAGVVLSQVDLKRYARYSSTGLYQRRIRLYLDQ